MMDKTELMRWAIKGLDAEIDSLEKSVNKGLLYIMQYEQGQQPKTSKTVGEIGEIVKAKTAEIERLYKMKSDIKWSLAMLEDEKQ